MRKIIFFAVASLLFFAVGLVASWVLMQRQAGAGADEDNTSIADLVPADPDATLRGGRQSGDGPETELPVVLRDQPVSADEVFRYGAMFESQQKALKKQQDALSRKNVRLDLVRADIQGTRRELDGMLAQIDDAMKLGEQLLTEIATANDQLSQKKDELDKQLQEMQKSGSDGATQEAANIKKMSRWVQSMAPEAAADFLRQMSDDGKIDLAAKLLVNLEEREGAKILAELQDLGLQIAEEMLKIRSPPKTATRNSRR